MNHKIIVNCKVQFETNEAYVGDTITLRVAAMINCPLPIRFNSIRIFFNAREFNHVIYDEVKELLPLALPEGANNSIKVSNCKDSVWKENLFQKKLDLYFYPGKLRIFEFSLQPKKSRDLKVSHYLFIYLFI